MYYCIGRHPKVRNNSSSNNNNSLLGTSRQLYGTTTISVAQIAITNLRVCSSLFSSNLAAQFHRCIHNSTMLNKGLF